MEIGASHKLVRKVSDSLFDEEQLDQYHLIVLSGASDLQLAVSHSETGKFLLLEDHVFPNAASPEESAQAFRHLLDSHHLLQAGFWNQITIGIKNSQFTQVPEQLFDQSNQRAALSLHSAITDEVQVYWNGSLQTDVITCFAIPQQIHSWLSGYYPKKNIRYAHQSAALIAGVESVHTGDDRIFAYVDRFKLHLIAMGSHGLRFYNQFQIKQFSDYTRYLMTVIGQMGLKQETCPVTLHGFVGKDSPHVHELRRYIKTLELGTRPKGFTWSNAFDEIQEHQFFDIFAVAHLRSTFA